jgi:hypothetical protein
MRPTFHRGLVVPVFHGAAICCSLLLGTTGEHPGQGAEDVKIEAGLQIQMASQ